MSPLVNQGKLKTILLAIMMIFSSALAGCVTDDGTIIVGEDENNNGGNETANNTSNETVDNAGNNTGNETLNNNTDDCANLDLNELKAELAELYGVDPALIQLDNPCDTWTPDDGNQTANNTGNGTANNTGEVPCGPNNDYNETVTNLPDGSVVIVEANVSQ